MIHIEITHPFSSQLGGEEIERAALVSMQHAAPDSDFDITIKITDDTAIQDLNNSFRGIDQPTDVLSFEAGELDPETGRTYLGDIIISCQQAERQARAGGHDVMDEIQLLVIHGLLHLLGYDHDTGKKKSRMWKAQKEILSMLDININLPDEDQPLK
jgi:probable rRNA maturation factor